MRWSHGALNKRIEKIWIEEDIKDISIMVDLNEEIISGFYRHFIRSFGGSSGAIVPITKTIILFRIFRPRLAIFGEAEAAKCCFCFWWQLHRKLILKSSVKFLEVVVLVFICIFQYKKPTFKPGQTPIKYSLHNHKSNRYYKVYKPTIKFHKVQLQ